MRMAFPSIVRFVREQILYIVISAVVGALFWAIGMQINLEPVINFMRGA
jgi:hypothetical protein